MVFPQEYYLYLDYPPFYFPIYVTSTDTYFAIHIINLALIVDSFIFRPSSNLFALPNSPLGWVSWMSCILVREMLTWVLIIWKIFLHQDPKKDRSEKDTILHWDSLKIMHYKDTHLSFHLHTQFHIFHQTWIPNGKENFIKLYIRVSAKNW